MSKQSARALCGLFILSVLLVASGLLSSPASADSFAPVSRGVVFCNAGTFCSGQSQSNWLGAVIFNNQAPQQGMPETGNPSIITNSGMPAVEAAGSLPGNTVFLDATPQKTGVYHTFTFNLVSSTPSDSVVTPEAGTSLLLAIGLGLVVLGRRRLLA